MKTILNANEILAFAVKRTKEIASSYWNDKLLDQHFEGSKNRAGSFFVGYSSKEELEHAILTAKWNIYEGSLEDGKVILHTNDLEGKSGIKKIQECSEVFEKESEQIAGRVEYVSYIETDEELPKTNDAWLIVSTYNPQRQTVNPIEPFIPTFFPGELIGPNDTVVGQGSYAKLIKK